MLKQGGEAGLLSVSIRSKLEAKNRWNKHW